MSRVAVLGAGGGGRSAVVELVRAGHDVRLWNRRWETIAAIAEAGVVRHRGVFGDGEVKPALVTTDLADALEGAEVMVVCLPTLVHAELFADLACLGVRAPMVLNPGHTGGALHARAAFGARSATQPATAEFSTLTYVARVGPDDAVITTGRARTVRVGCLPGHEIARDWGMRLFPGASPVPDVFASSLSNVNLVLHPPGAVLASAWAEATAGDFLFYVDAVTSGVARVLEALDNERLSVAKAYGHVLPTLIEEMALIGTADASAVAKGDVVAAIRGGAANAAIKAPASFDHRYYREDLAFGLLPFLALADVADVDVPIASALWALGAAVAKLSPLAGLDAGRLGVARMSFEDLCSLART